MLAFLRGAVVTLIDRVAPEQSDEMRRHLLGIATSRKFGLVACASCRLIWSVTDEPSRRAVETTECYLDAAVGEREWREAAEGAAVARQALGTGPRDPDRFLFRAKRAAALAAERAAYLDWEPAVEESAMAAVWSALATSLPDARAERATLIRDIVGNPFRPVMFAPEWRTGTVVTLARTMYDAREFGAMPILADALQDAGCDSDDLLNHCRSPDGMHVRGCWVVDLVLGKDQS
jgi:hypothetical protein